MGNCVQHVFNSESLLVEQQRIGTTFPPATAFTENRTAMPSCQFLSIKVFLPSRHRRQETMVSISIVCRLCVTYNFIAKGLGHSRH